MSGAAEHGRPRRGRVRSLGRAPGVGHRPVAWVLLGHPLRVAFASSMVVSSGTSIAPDITSSRASSISDQTSAVDVFGLQQRDAFVFEGQDVAFFAERAFFDLFAEGLVRRGEVPQHRGQQHALLVDRGHVADVADVPDLVARVGGFDRLQVAERGAVAHAEDHVGAFGDHARRDPFAAGGVVIAFGADLGEGDRHLRVDAVHAGRVAARHLEPVGVRGGDDHADLAGLGRLRRQDPRQVGTFLALRGDAREDAGLHLVRDVVGDGGDFVFFGDPLGGGVVAARVRDQQARFFLSHLFEDRFRLFVADVRVGFDFGAELFSGFFRGFDALFVPPVVVGLRGRRDRDLRDFAAAGFFA